MGLDAEIYVRINKELSEPFLSKELRLIEANNYVLEEIPLSTHQVLGLPRFYWFDYARGDWPTIAECFMRLFANPYVHKVWYGNDQEGVCLFKPEDVLLLSKFYMRHGNRPWLISHYELGETIEPDVSNFSNFSLKRGVGFPSSLIRSKIKTCDTKQN